MKILHFLNNLIPVLIFLRMGVNASDNETSSYASRMRVAIIGAGAAGLVSARFCTDPAFNFSCEIFEQTDELGGTWVYTPKTGFDEYGLPIHTSMYHDLVTNIPKEIMLFPDFKYPDYKNSFITREQVLKYLQDYAKHYNIEQLIQYRHLVKEVHPLPNDKWLVTVSNLRNKTDVTKEFDAVLVCNGHNNKPNVPSLPGKDLFKGTQIHSHDYRTAEVFENKTVLIIGAGPSGVDILSEIYPFASRVILSYRTKSKKWTFPKNVTFMPEVSKLTEHGAFFSDGTYEKMDAVIYCTGFQYSFPFLSKECGITVESNAVQPLYKHMVNIEKPTMGFIGLTFTGIPFKLFYYQVLLFMKQMNGDIQRPTKEEMYLDTEKDLALRREKGYPRRFTHKLGLDFQQPYFNDIAKLAKVKLVPNVIFKIYADTSLHDNKKLNYKIIDDENFIKSEIKS